MLLKNNSDKPIRFELHNGIFIELEPGSPYQASSVELAHILMARGLPLVPHVEEQPEVKSELKPKRKAK